MDTVLIELVRQAPLAGLVLYMWRQSAEERKEDRREFRDWFTELHRQFLDVVGRNSEALTRNTEVMGAFSTVRCPMSDNPDRGHLECR